MNTHTTAVKIVDSQLGKAEIVNNGGDLAMIDNIAVKGLIFTSRELSGYTNGEMLLCEIEITGKGSRKVRSVTAYVAPQVNAQIDAQIDTRAMGCTTDKLVYGNDNVVDSIVDNIAQSAQSAQSASVGLPSVDILAWQSPDYYIAPKIRLGFQTAYNMLNRDPNRAVKMLLTGESGSGKTTLAEKIAKLLGLEYVRINCATMRDVTDWFGYAEVSNDNGTSVTSFDDTQFSRSITRGNCLIVLDEFNRVQPDLHNSLFPLLDDSQSTEVHNRVYTVGPNVLFVATINQGFEYNATFDIDLAMVNRFDFVLPTGKMPSEYEIPLLVNRIKINDFDATEIVRVANILRDSNLSCSTRETIRMARMVLNGLSVRQAFDFAVIERIPPTKEYEITRKNYLDLINAHLGYL